MLKSHSKNGTRRPGTARFQSGLIRPWESWRGSAWRHYGEAAIAMLALMGFGLGWAGLESFGQAERGGHGLDRPRVTTYSELQERATREAVAPDPAHAQLPAADGLASERGRAEEPDMREET